MLSFIFFFSLLLSSWLRFPISFLYPRQRASWSHRFLPYRHSFNAGRGGVQTAERALSTRHGHIPSSSASVCLGVAALTCASAPRR